MLSGPQIVLQHLVGLVYPCWGQPEHAGVKIPLQVQDWLTLVCIGWVMQYEWLLELDVVDHSQLSKHLCDQGMAAQGMHNMEVVNVWHTYGWDLA